MSLANPTTPPTAPAFRDRAPCGEPPADGLVDAVIVAGAIAAVADGSVHPVERLEMLVYMRRSGLSLLRRRDVLSIFDQRVRELRDDPDSAMQASKELLESFSGSYQAWIVLRAAEHVAAADSRMLDSELMAIRSVRTALGLQAGRLEDPALV